MYGFFILALIAAPILIFVILWCTFPYRLSGHYQEKLSYTDPGTGMRMDFHNYNHEITALSTRNPELLKQLQKDYKKYKFWRGAWLDYDVLKVALIVICALVLFVSLLVPLVALTDAKQEVAYWEEFAPMAEEVIGEADEYQSIAIADKVIEYNTWLAKAKSSKKTWGNWSQFYYSDLSDLEYITLNPGGK